MSEQALPKKLGIFFKFKRKILRELRRCATRSLIIEFERLAGSSLQPSIIVAIQTFGSWFHSPSAFSGDGERGER
jgi:hypothetical protein